MKQTITLVFFSAFLMLSCTSEPLDVVEQDISANLFNVLPGGDTSNVLPLYEDTLFAGQTIAAGTGFVNINNGELEIIYETTGDWVIEETHLYVGPLADIPLNNAGNPIIGQFPFNDTQTSGTTLVTYTTDTIPLGGCVYVAAHAVVTNTVTGESETAWFNGDPIGGNSWAMATEVCNI